MRLSMGVRADGNGLESIYFGLRRSGFSVSACGVRVFNAAPFVAYRANRGAKLYKILIGNLWYGTIHI